MSPVPCSVTPTPNLSQRSRTSTLSPFVPHSITQPHHPASTRGRFPHGTHGNTDEIWHRHPATFQVRPVNSGTATLKDATSEAIRDWVTNVETTHYILGSAAGPHPYPAMVRDFQAVIGRETRQQCMDKFGGKPDILMACIGGGSNAIGLFHEFVEDDDVRLIGAPPLPL